MEQTEQYLEFMKYGRQLSDNTIKSIEHDFIIFGDNLDTAKRMDVERFVMSQNKQGLSTATVARRVSSIKGFFDWQIMNELRTGNNPANGKLAPKIKNVSHKAITYEELNELYVNAPNNALRVAIALTGYAGLRLGEVVGLGSKNIVYKDNKGNYAIHLTETKGDKERHVSLGFVPEPLLILKAYQSGGLLGERGFLSENGLWRQMSKYFKNMGFTDFSPHGLRATFATITVKNGLRVDIVRDLLGHSTLEGNSITSRYVGVTSVEDQYIALQTIGGN